MKSAAVPAAHAHSISSCNVSNASEFQRDHALHVTRAIISVKNFLLTVPEKIRRRVLSPHKRAYDSAHERLYYTPCFLFQWNYRSFSIFLSKAGLADSHFHG